MILWNVIVYAALAAVTCLCGFSDAGAVERTTIMDMAGRRVSIPKEVNRVVPIWGALRFVVYLQAVDRVVGIERVEKTLPIQVSAVYRLALEGKIAGLPVIGEGGPDKLPDYEALIAVRPDIILTMSADVAQADRIQQKTGIPVVMMSYGGLGVFDSKVMQQSTRMLGAILDRARRADELNRFLAGLESDLRRRTSGVNRRPTAYVGGLGFKGRHGITSTQPSFLPLQLANGRNVADDIGRQSHLFVDPEKILAWDPEFIFLDAGGLELISLDYRNRPEFYRKLRAVRDGKVFSLFPHNSYHTNIETALANAYFIGKQLYPERFKDIDPAVQADYIYEFFLRKKAYGRLRSEHNGFLRVIFDRDGITYR